MLTGHHSAPLNHSVSCQLCCHPAPNAEAPMPACRKAQLGCTARTLPHAPQPGSAKPGLLQCSLTSVIYSTESPRPRQGHRGHNSPSPLPFNGAPLAAVRALLPKPCPRESTASASMLRIFAMLAARAASALALRASLAAAARASGDRLSASCSPLLAACTHGTLYDMATSSCGPDAQSQILWSCSQCRVEGCHACMRPLPASTTVHPESYTEWV